MIKILFMGTPKYAQIILEALVSTTDFEVVGLFCQPDKPVGRKQILTPPETKAFLVSNHPNIPIFQPQSLKNSEIVDEIKKLRPDFIVVAAYGQILPKEILTIAPCINLHASILPKYRGASPIQESILNQEEYAGVTVIMMNEALDSGDMLAFLFLRLNGNETTSELTITLANLAKELTKKVLKEFSSINPLPQYDALATYCKKIKKSDGEIDFDDALTIALKFRAFKSWPEIYTSSGLKLTSLELIETTSSNIKGQILDILKDSIIVGCQKGSIKIFRVKPQNKNEMDILSYLRGKRLKIGDILV